MSQDEDRPPVEEEKNLEEEKSEEKKESVDTAPKPKEKRKYIFNCTKCGECCADRPSIPVTFLDLEKWMKKGVIQAVFPYLQLEVVKPSDELPEYIQMSLKKTDGSTGCPLYDADNKLCNIYHSLPMECDAFPLGYNGQNFVLKMITCQGLGEGKMTKEQLIEDRKKAQDDFEAKVMTANILPLVNTLFFKHMMKQQEEMMANMPEDQRQKLDEILKGAKEPPKDES
ncbi:MAG: YkgJ family cysteine cluster protein [Promethearchaeota archaeon]